MRSIPIYQVDAFTDRPFAGNPAAVCPLDDWLPDALMQSIATENNLSETAFFVPVGPAHYHLRWFTPVDEVDLCGHATLASSHVVFTHLLPDADKIVFDSRGGPLTITRTADGYQMDFPALPLNPTAPPEAIINALGADPVAAIHNDHVVLIELADEKAVRELSPDYGALKIAESRCVAVTARGEQVDFVSRFFAPCHDIDEDPVTGSAHCSLVPYWAPKLGKNTLQAHQLSARGGQLSCTLAGDRVLLAGQAVEVMRGRFFIE